MIRDYAAVVAALSDEQGVTAGRMFASEGLSYRKKIFAMEVRGRLVVKISAARAAELHKTGIAVPFDPGHGRLMKQWIAIERTAPVDWLELSREALVFARQAAPPKRRS